MLTRGGLLDLERRLLEEIADKRLTRDDIAMTYALALGGYVEDVNWARVNAAIMERWSLSALKYIKQQAWAMVGTR